MPSPWQKRSRAVAAGTLPDLPGVDHLVPEGDDIPPLWVGGRHRAEGTSPPRAALRAYRSKESVLGGPSSDNDMSTRRRPERQPSYYVDHGHPPPIPSLSQLPASARVPLVGYARGGPPPAESSSPTLSEADIPLVTATTIPEREVEATASPRSLLPPLSTPDTSLPFGITSPGPGRRMSRAPTPPCPSSPKATDKKKKRNSIRSKLGSWFQNLPHPALHHHRRSTSSSSHVVPPTTLAAARRRDISGPSYDVIARYDNPAWDPRLKDGAREGGDVLAGEGRVPHPVFSQLREREEREREEVEGRAGESGKVEEGGDGR